MEQKQAYAILSKVAPSVSSGQITLLARGDVSIEQIGHALVAFGVPRDDMPPVFTHETYGCDAVSLSGEVKDRFYASFGRYCDLKGLQDDLNKGRGAGNPSP